MAPPKKKSGGRTTPKGTKPGVPTAKAPAPNVRTDGARHATQASSRYTPPIPKSKKSSPRWWGGLVFGLIGVGVLVIVLNYMELIWGASSVLLFVGLGFILAGIIAATSWR
jgi:hypothetical protein